MYKLFAAHSLYVQLKLWEICMTESQVLFSVYDVMMVVFDVSFCMPTSTIVSQYSILELFSHHGRECGVTSKS